MFVATIDVWGTLIKASPTFKDAKIELVRKKLNIEPSNLSDFEINMCFNQAKEDLNKVIEGSGCQPSNREIFTMLFYAIRKRLKDNNMSTELIDHYIVNSTFYEHFHNAYQDLSLEHPPVVYSENTLEYVKKLSKQLDKVIVSSNTMFISGQTLYSHLKKMGFEFIQCYFSDQQRLAKPSQYMYYTKIGVGNSFHIGDNPITDFEAPNLFGVKGILINSNNLTIKDAYNYIIDQIK